MPCFDELRKYCFGQSPRDLPCLDPVDHILSCLGLGIHILEHYEYWACGNGSLTQASNLASTWLSHSMQMWVVIISRLSPCMCEFSSLHMCEFSSLRMCESTMVPVLHGIPKKEYWASWICLNFHFIFYFYQRKTWEPFAHLGPFHSSWCADMNRAKVGNHKKLRPLI